MCISVEGNIIKTGKANMSWRKYKKALVEFYTENGLSQSLNSDEEYLHKAYIGISKLWEENADTIESVNYVMIAEAPLWGANKSYIYNLKSANTQFFYRSDLEYILNRPLSNKSQFLGALANAGFLVIDISPFAFNNADTSINYRTISTKQYKSLLYRTLPGYFLDRMSFVDAKLSNRNCFFFRYSRVRESFGNLIEQMLAKAGYIDGKNPLIDISQKGGGIGRLKLSEIMSKSRFGS
jgi:hypothetical protein